jgi:hypothetical protein
VAPVGLARLMVLPVLLLLVKAITVQQEHRRLARPAAEVVLVRQELCQLLRMVLLVELVLYQPFQERTQHGQAVAAVELTLGRQLPALAGLAAAVVAVIPE